MDSFDPQLLPCKQGKISLINHYLEMSKTRSQLNSATEDRSKRKRKLPRLGVKKQKTSDNIGIDKLPDEMLVAIISCMSLKEAGRTSVLSRRWKYLWTFTSGSLDFDAKPTATGTRMKSKKFKAWVNQVLKSHQSPQVDTLSIRFCDNNLRGRSGVIDSWVYFAMRKEIKRFELNMSLDALYCSHYKFPKMDKLLHQVKSAFRYLRSLRLVDVSVEDEVVQYFLASSPCLEELSLMESKCTKNLQVVDPLPNLKFLKIYNCDRMKNLEISSENLVSFSYKGSMISLPFKKVPKLSELTLGGNFCESFIFEPHKHSSYSVQLVKLTLNISLKSFGPKDAPRDLPQLYSLKRLELSTVSQVGRSLLFFTSLIKASPLLHEFRIEIDYMSCTLEGRWWENTHLIPFPNVLTAWKRSKFYHKNLKVVEMAGFIGCKSERKFLLRLAKIAPSLEKVVINTSEFFDEEPLLYWKRIEEVYPELVDQLHDPGAQTRMEARQRAEYLQSKFPPEIQLVID